jgi:cytochrome d ubiquinol oxidase subunit II
VLAVLVCAYLAAVFLCLDARREGRDDLADQFRTRALGTAGDDRRRRPDRHLRAAR